MTTGLAWLVFLMPVVFIAWWEWAVKRDDKRRKQRDKEYLDRLDRILALRAQGNAFGEALTSGFHSALRRRDDA